MNKRTFRVLTHVRHRRQANLFKKEANSIEAVKFLNSLLADARQALKSHSSVRVVGNKKAVTFIAPNFSLYLNFR